MNHSGEILKKNVRNNLHINTSSSQVEIAQIYLQAAQIFRLEQ